MIRWQRNLTRGVLALALVVGLGGPTFAKPAPEKRDKVDRFLRNRAGKSGTSRVIITLKPGFDVSSDARKLGGRLGRRLGLINGQVLELPNAVIRKLADLPFVESIHYDRPTGGEMNRVAVTVGARAAQALYGYSGAGVGVAVIDSGVTGWHDDLTYYGNSSAVRVKNGQRVAAFVDFVNNRTAPYDDNGHGTHVAGIIAGNGADSLGVRAGIAPSAHLVSLKVLDARGGGYISDVIAALDWVDRQQGRLQPSGGEPVGRRGGYRVLQHRPADARGQARRGRRHRRRHRGGQPRKERQRTDAVRRHHRSGQRALGADRRSVQPRGHGLRVPTT